MKKSTKVIILLAFLLFVFSCTQPVFDVQVTADQSAAAGRGESKAVATLIPEWVSTGVYEDGAQVTWTGRLYEAKWWTAGEQPDQSGEWGVWKDLGPANHFLRLEFNVSHQKVSPGGSATLTWSAQNAVSITATGSWSGSKAASGSETVGSINSYSEYHIEAVDAAGISLSLTMAVMVERIEPVIMFSADNYSVAAGETATLSWEVSDAVSLTASGTWSGSKPMSGSFTTGPINSLTNYVLTAVDSSGVTRSRTVSVTVTQTYPELALGQSRILTDDQIVDRYRGIDPDFRAAEVAGSIQELMSKTQYEELFPLRIGSTGWEQYTQETHEDYYSYDNFLLAFADIADVKIRIETKNYANRIFRLNKATKEETYIMEHPEYNVSWLQNVVPEVDVVDYGQFSSEGTLETRKREFAAFLANIAHETTGGWPTAPGGPYAWGLFFKEEVYHNDTCSCGTYTNPSSVAYPPKPGECYHGRGPMQLSWNMNYGLLSQVLYADKNILLNNPDILAHEGNLGIVAAIWFWMTPQLPKPACHNAMIGTWEPTTADIAANRLPGFGVTINIINGAQEAGKPGNSRVLDRIGFFEKITTDFGVSMGDNVDCGNQQSF